nr:MAG TPA: hypothetical protein [Caudoviricetes sp.]
MCGGGTRQKAGRELLPSCEDIYRIPAKKEKVNTKQVKNYIRANEKNGIKNRPRRNLDRCAEGDENVDQRINPYPWAQHRDQCRGSGALARFCAMRCALRTGYISPGQDPVRVLDAARRFCSWPCFAVKAHKSIPIHRRRTNQTP